MPNLNKPSYLLVFCPIFRHYIHPDGHPSEFAAPYFDAREARGAAERWHCQVRAIVPDGTYSRFFEGLIENHEEITIWR